MNTGFADQREGNQLAIIADARGLSDAEMQAIARETNLSETTFIFPRAPRSSASAVSAFASSRPQRNCPSPAILPSDLDSEIARVLREVDVMEDRALARWHTLQPPILAGQPPVLANIGTEATETLGELMLFDKNMASR